MTKPTTVSDVAQLLLEDDASIRHALVRALTERGHAVSSTSTAMDALQQVVAAPPDLVILDLGLPGLDGYEALRMLRAVSAVPVVVATARDDEADIVRALNAGADDYLIKPFGPGQIDARVRAVLRRAGEAGRSRPAPIRLVACGWTGKHTRPSSTAFRLTSADANSICCTTWPGTPGR